MLSHLSRQEVHAVIKALADLYVKEGGHPDLNITLEREVDNSGQTETVTGFQVDFDADAVTLGVGGADIRHVRVPLTGVVGVTVSR